MTATLFDQVVEITEEYLGPAAHRFVARQVIAHFDKAPEELAVADLPKLVEWTRITLALLTEDQRLIDECSDKIAHLATAQEKIEK